MCHHVHVHLGIEAFHVHLGIEAFWRQSFSLEFAKKWRHHATFDALIYVSSYANDKHGAVLLIEAGVSRSAIFLQNSPFFRGKWVCHL